MTTLLSTENVKVAASAGVKASIANGTELPVLDVGPYLAGEPGALEQLAADVKWIQENLGFFAIVNHGIPQSLIDESFRQTAKLFEIPMEEKIKHRVGFHHQGYLPPKSSILKLDRHRGKNRGQHQERHQCRLAVHAQPQCR